MRGRKKEERKEGPDEDLLGACLSRVESARLQVVVVSSRVVWYLCLLQHFIERERRLFAAAAAAAAT